MKRKLLMGLAALGAAAAVGLGSAALASGNGPVQRAVYACEGSGHVVVTMLSSPSSACPAGSTSIVVGGPISAAIVQPVIVSAIFSLTGRDDSGGAGNWAKDNISRDVIITQHGVVASSDCPGAVSDCRLYTMTIGDTGTFTTDAGAFTPNQGGADKGVKISGVVTGSLSGGGDQEFYADMAPRVPTILTYSGNAPLGTSEWYKLFFPGVAGEPVGHTDFGLTGAAQAPWTSWAWSYDAPKTCETWVDSIANNDGQGSVAAPPAGDGDIAGVNHCA